MTISPPKQTPTTEERVWLQALSFVPIWRPGSQRVVVVAPHPDDETLGAGGLIAMQCASKVPVLLLAVTDGEAAYPDAPDLGSRRREEQALAAEALGIGSTDVVRFSLRDSAVTASESDLTDRMEALTDSNTLLVAPWSRDPHPDHEACGRAAMEAARRTGATVISYFFWTWHRFRPEHLDGLPLRRMQLTAEAESRRGDALRCHTSQLYRDEGEPILPEIFLAPARRPFETFVIYGD